MRHPLSIGLVAAVLIAAVVSVFAAGVKDKRGGNSILLRGTHQRGWYSGAPGMKFPAELLPE
jgi:hypothetical protein